MSAVIDGHVHLWNRTRHPQEWIDPATMADIDRDFGADELHRMLAVTGAGVAILVQSTNSITETADLLTLSADPTVAGVVGWIDLVRDVPAQLADLRAGSGGEALRGIRHLAHQEADASWLLRDDVARGLSALAASGLPFDLIVRDHQLPVAASVVRAHPDLEFVLDHLGNPSLGRDLTAWRRDLAALAAEPNVVAKISGLVTAAPRDAWNRGDLASLVDQALETFGPVRVLYGSDYPLVELADGAAAWALELREMLTLLSPNEQAAVFGGTAAAVYRVPVDA